MHHQRCLPRWCGLALLLILALPVGLQADVVFPQATLDLGELRTGQLLVQQVPLLNRGSTPAEIIEVKGSCNCLRPELAVRQLMPGSSTLLQLHINTLSAAAGPQAWRVQVRYRSDGALQEATLLIQAKIVPEIVVQPPTLTVYASGPTQHELTLTDLRPRTFRLRQIESRSPHLQSQLVEEQQDAAGRLVRRFRLTLAETLPVGRHDEQVTLFTDDPLHRELRIAVSAVRRGRQRVQVLPGEVALTASASQPTPSRLVTLRDAQGPPIVIERVIADDPAVTCHWSAGPQSLATIRITVDRAKMTTESLTSRVQVSLQQPEGESATILVRCERR